MNITPTKTVRADTLKPGDILSTAGRLTVAEVTVRADAVIVRGRPEGASPDRRHDVVTLLPADTVTIIAPAADRAVFVAFLYDALTNVAEASTDFPDLDEVTRDNGATVVTFEGWTLRLEA